MTTTALTAMNNVETRHKKEDKITLFLIVLQDDSKQHTASKQKTITYCWVQVN
jgi:hypothetical protein